MIKIKKQTFLEIKTQTNKENDMRTVLLNQSVMEKIKDINGVEINVGDKIEFYTFTPIKKLNKGIVKLKYGMLFTEVIPIILLTKNRRELKVIN